MCVHKLKSKKSKTDAKEAKQNVQEDRLMYISESGVMQTLGGEVSESYGGVIQNKLWLNGMLGGPCKYVWKWTRVHE